MATYNLTVDDSASTVNVTVSDGVFIDQSGGVKFISGWVVIKAAGNTASTIETGDYCIGWLSDTFVAGVSVAGGTPSVIADLSVAVSGEPFP